MRLHINSNYIQYGALIETTHDFILESVDYLFASKDMSGFAKLLYQCTIWKKIYELHHVQGTYTVTSYIIMHGYVVLTTFNVGHDDFYILRGILSKFCT